MAGSSSGPAARAVSCALLLCLAVCAQAQKVIAVNVDGIIHPVSERCWRG